MKTLYTNNGVKRLIFAKDITDIKDRFKDLISELRYNDIKKYEIKTDGIITKIILDYKDYLKREITINDIIKCFEAGESF